MSNDIVENSLPVLPTRKEMAAALVRHEPVAHRHCCFCSPQECTPDIRVGMCTYCEEWMYSR